MNYSQWERSLQETKYGKWEAGDIPFEAKLSTERTERLFNLVTNYQNRDTNTIFKGSHIILHSKLIFSCLYIFYLINHYTLLFLHLLSPIIISIMIKNILPTLHYF